MLDILQGTQYQLVCIPPIVLGLWLGFVRRSFEKKDDDAFFLLLTWMCYSAVVTIAETHFAKDDILLTVIIRDYIVNLFLVVLCVGGASFVLALFVGAFIRWLASQTLPNVWWI